MPPTIRGLTIGPDPHGTAVVYGAVAVAAGLHAAWNLLAKAMRDQVVAFFLINLTTAVTGSVLLAFGRPARAAWPYLLASIVIHVFYNAGLIAAYRHGDLGQTYPVARGIAPLLVAVGAWVFASERLSGWQVAGVAVVAVGLTSLVWSRGRGVLGDRRALLAAVATGITIASYSVVDGIGVRRAGAGGALGYGGALFCIQGLLLVAGVMIVRRRPLPAPPDRTWLLGLAGGALSITTYLVVLWAQGRADLAVVSGLRETSVVVAALLGSFLLREGDRRRRIVAASVVCLGTVLLVAA